MQSMPGAPEPQILRIKFRLGRQVLVGNAPL
jgi:hypothetical protein